MWEAGLSSPPVSGGFSGEVRLSGWQTVYLDRCDISLGVAVDAVELTVVSIAGLAGWVRAAGGAAWLRLNCRK